MKSFLGNFFFLQNIWDFENLEIQEKKMLPKRPKHYSDLVCVSPDDLKLSYWGEPVFTYLLLRINIGQKTKTEIKVVALTFLRQNRNGNLTWVAKYSFEKLLRYK